MIESNETVLEPPRRTAVIGSHDVVVVGGGPAGCAAALYAARHGADVLLVEKAGHLGGTTVQALVSVVLSTNGVDLQGVWHELHREMTSLNGFRRRHSGKYEFAGTWDPEAVKVAWDALLSDAGVSILHHVHATGALLEGGAIVGLFLETRAGRAVVKAARIIDCTGDGVVGAHAGVEWAQGDGSHAYALAATKVFRLGNVKDAGVPIGDEQQQGLAEALDRANRDHQYTAPEIVSGRVLKYAKGRGLALPHHRSEVLLVVSRLLELDPLDPYQVSEAEREGRQRAREIADFFHRHVPGFEDAYLVDTANDLGIRSSRRLSGRETVTTDDLWSLRKRTNGVARASWDIDLWPADSHTRPPVAWDDERYIAWRENVDSGDWYEIPFGALVAAGVNNLMMAGRCISAEHEPESSLRIQQTCMATGQAAGTAAALSLARDERPDELDSEVLLRQLADDRDAVEGPL